MASPDNSPQQNLQGASRTTGGILRGRAAGNAFNFADAPDFAPPSMTPVMGKLHLYSSRVNPMSAPPDMSLNHEVSPTLAPILQDLGERFSPVRSELLVNYLPFYCFIFG